MLCSKVELFEGREKEVIVKQLQKARSTMNNTSSHVIYFFLKKNPQQ